MSRVSVKVDKNNDLTKIGAAIRARRLAMEMSQEALADYAGIDRSHMGRIERGERNVSLLNILRIANAMNCKALDFFLDADI
ncbi:helix-turn-helix domain-containing protein [Oxalicibacterium solurbis]|nr:helix-turn-helix transcriptional regulator [Oxalicibacterium solurbis]